MTWERARTFEERFVYFTECQLATIEYARSLKKTSKHELQRHENIAEKMIQSLIDFKVDVDRVEAGRVFEILTERGALPLPEKKCDHTCHECGASTTNSHSTDVWCSRCGKSV